jgi:hypothetical protein
MVGRTLALLAVAGLLVAELLVSGCGDDTKESKKFPEMYKARFKAAKLTPGSLDDAQAERYGAKRCYAGEVAGLGVLLCRFASAEEAKKAESKLLGFVGKAVTGVVRQRGPDTIVVVDRDKSDLRGKKINRILKAFEK